MTEMVFLGRLIQAAALKRNGEGGGGGGGGGMEWENIEG